ncbi:DUF4102 domain-containing protein [Pelatocladus sp. BLCC-F211]|uniref:DUF4102 domain-containing protein n=1 Tax=Pelatocladus sp. BLCC-F211 TaxID=3342752 RepID=UPI0035B92219
MSYEQLQLALNIPLQQSPQTVHDSYWDELESRGSSTYQNQAGLIDQATSTISKSTTPRSLPDSGGDNASQPVEKPCDNFDGIFTNTDVAPQHLVHCVGAQIPLLEPPYKSVGAQVKVDTKKSAPQQDIPTHWVEKYWVERNTNKYWYYRYCWMEGRKKHRVYIGSVNSTRASQIKVAVELAIASGESPQGIKQMIVSCSGKDG